jgi:uncharacterized membrane protein
MLPLFILLSIYLVSILTGKWRGRPDTYFSGRLAMSGMLLFTTIGHFRYTAGMAMMLPALVPFRRELILFTGVFEIVAAIGLLSEKYVLRASWLLIVFLIMVLPANLYASWHHISYQRADFTGPGLKYLWFRIPLQLLFIGWVYYFGIAKKRKAFVRKNAF